MDLQKKMEDHIVEEIWKSFEDVTFIEDRTSSDSCGLVLEADWNNGINDFPEGTTRDDIQHWFDEHHSKGISWLLYSFCEE